MNQERKSLATTETGFLGKTMNFVNAIHVNGRCNNKYTIKKCKCIQMVTDDGGYISLLEV